MADTGVLITFDDVEPALSSHIEKLLCETYVGAGFTDHALAAQMFQAASVRARGRLLLARDHENRELQRETLKRPGGIFRSTAVESSR